MKQLCFGLFWIVLMLVGCDSSEEPDVQFLDGKDNTEDTSDSSSDATAFTGQAFGDFVYLSWQEVAGYSYKLYKQNPTFQQEPAFLKGFETGVTSFKDRNLRAGRSYYYRLEACSSESECSPLGKEIRLQTGSPQRPLEVVTITSAEYDRTNNRIVVTWNDVPSANKYNLWKKELTGSFQEQENLIGPLLEVTSYSDASVEDASRNSYRVTACSSDNQCTDYSDEFVVGVGVENLLTDPVIQKKDLDIESRNFALGWDRVQLAEYYEVERNLNGTGYVRLGTTTSFEFTDPVGANIGGTLRYRLRACSDRWGCSNYMNTENYIIKAISSTPLSVGRAQARLVPEQFAVSLAEPQVLLSSNRVFLFWTPDDRVESGAYFKVTINDGTARTLSSNQPILELDYENGQTLELLKCSDRLYACNEWLSLRLESDDLPSGRTDQPIITARHPEATGLAWNHDLSEDFIVIDSTRGFDHMLNPVTEEGNQRRLQISTLEQGQTYSIRMINCQLSDQSFLYYCKAASPAQSVSVPEYDLGINMFKLREEWSKGTLPLVSFTGYSLDHIGDDNQYNLVVQRDCVGVACFDLSQDLSAMLENYQVAADSVVFVDQRLDQLMPSGWNQVDARLEIHYTLWLCLSDLSKCSQGYPLVADREATQAHIMAFNPTRLGIENSLHVSLAHHWSEANEQVELELTRYYTNSLAATAQAYDLSEELRYNGRSVPASQALVFSNVGTFAQTRPWYFNHDQISSQLRTASDRLVGEGATLRQDALVGLSVEGVEKIIRLTENQICVQLDDGTIKCSGDSQLASSRVSDTSGSRHLALVRDTLASPMFSVEARSQCGSDGSDSSLSSLRAGSDIFAIDDRLCLINSAGDPYCFDSGEQPYMCPLTSLVALEPAQAASTAGHLCALGESYGDIYCWGDLAGAVPFITSEQTAADPVQVRFFNSSDTTVKADTVYSGENFTCLLYQTDEYCYSRSYGWTAQQAPVPVRFPDGGTITRDRAAYGALMCWLQTDTKVSYIHCVNGGADTDLGLPDATVTQGDLLNTFLLARLPENLSADAKLFIDKQTICVFDRPNLWCAGDTGYVDHGYNDDRLKILAKVELPFYQLHDFAMGDSGEFCVSYGTKKTLSCWNRGTKLISAELPEGYWPLFGSTTPERIALADDYSCASQGSSLACWGKTTNPVTPEPTGSELTQPEPTWIDTQSELLDLQTGRQSACYRQQRGWFCWGKVDYLSELIDLADTTGTEKEYLAFGGAQNIAFNEGIETLSLAPDYDGLCLVDRNRSVHCVGGQISDTPDYQHEAVSLIAIADQNQQPLHAAGTPMFVGHNTCVLATKEARYALYCWQQSVSESGAIRYSPARVVIDDLPEDPLLASSASLLLAYNQQTQKLVGWNSNSLAYTVKPVSIVGRLNQITVWPSQHPLAVGLTDGGQLIWLNLLVPGDNGIISSLGSTQELAVGTNNICARQQTATLCGGDNSFGKSGLIE